MGGRPLRGYVGDVEAAVEVVRPISEAVRTRGADAIRELSLRFDGVAPERLRVPAEALWGAQTARAVENFPISGLRVPAEIVHALARVKAAAAEVNAELGALDQQLAGAIADAAAEVADGRHDDHFPIDVLQTGLGTSCGIITSRGIGRSIRLSWMWSKGHREPKPEGRWRHWG